MGTGCAHHGDGENPDNFASDATDILLRRQFVELRRTAFERASTYGPHQLFAYPIWMRSPSQHDTPPLGPMAGLSVDCVALPAKLQQGLWGHHTDIQMCL